MPTEGILAVARDRADKVLFPDAMRVDQLDALPGTYLEAFAAAGLYGAPAPAAAGGLGLDLPELGRVIEELAGGCLAAALDQRQALRVGARCAATGVADVIDVSVALCARDRGHAVVTSDPDDIRAAEPSLMLLAPV